MGFHPLKEDKGTPGQQGPKGKRVNGKCIRDLRGVSCARIIGHAPFISSCGIRQRSPAGRGDPMKHRRLSPGERMHAAAARFFPPYATQLWIEGDGRISLEELGKAMDLVAAANPGVRWKRRGSWWVQGERPRIRESSCPESVKKERMDMRSHPCELVKLPGGLLFRSCHALMDGGGLLFWAGEFFRALRGEALQGTDTLISDREYLLKHGKPGRPQIHLEHGSPFAGGEGFTWMERCAPAGDHAFVAKALAGLCREKGGTYMIPVDLRRFGDMRTTGNMTNMLVLKVEARARWEEIQLSLMGLLERGGALLHDWREMIMFLSPVFPAGRRPDSAAGLPCRFRCYQTSGRYGAPMGDCPRCESLQPERPARLPFPHVYRLIFHRGGFPASRGAGGKLRNPRPRFSDARRMINRSRTS